MTSRSTTSGIPRAATITTPKEDSDEILRYISSAYEKGYAVMREDVVLAKVNARVCTLSIEREKMSGSTNIIISERDKFLRDTDRP